jgi:hypothetical protein
MHRNRRTAARISGVPPSIYSAFARLTAEFELNSRELTETTVNWGKTVVRPFELLLLT